MFKLLHPVLTAFILFLCVNGNCQQPVLVVQSFEYIWEKEYNIINSRVIIPADDQAKLLIKNSFSKAIQNRWNIVLPDVSLAVKQLSLLANSPKFKTTLKDKEPGKWHLFLQLFDKAGFQNNMPSTTLDLKCRLINGADDSVIFDRNLTVHIYNEPVPEDQVPLKRLPSYPPYFVQGFDSIATWLFQPEPLTEKSLFLKPACVFEATTIKNKPIKELLFNSDTENIQHPSDLEFSLHPGEIKYKKTDTKRNFGGNAVSSTLTILTGLRTNKSRSFLYEADFSFEEHDSIYHCLIYYAEKKTKDLERVKNNDKSFSTKSTDYNLLGRHMDPTFLNLVMLGKDTLATFSVKYSNKTNANASYNQMWDGSDSTTIIVLPPEWNNKDDETNVIISGTLDGYSFLMKTSRDTRIKDFFVNDQLVITMLGNNKPEKARVFQPVSNRQLILFTILSSLPYSYFNQSY